MVLFAMLASGHRAADVAYPRSLYPRAVPDVSLARKEA
ncbi:hypothetical protein FHX37_2744 [Haloactinospora alba]|uniref:Uncharacterized protein n=1 Tax=Haloactinospora alba TaxID=405555 RepID=A0A543NLR9_9ACTN|nr:hypothetical protein FHX37_2744 [Haloactinospora alba]